MAGASRLEESPRAASRSRLVEEVLGGDAGAGEAVADALGGVCAGEAVADPACDTAMEDLSAKSSPQWSGRTRNIPCVAKKQIWYESMRTGCSFRPPGLFLLLVFPARC